MAVAQGGGGKKRPSSSLVPRAFSPPYGGSGYYGRGYRYEQVLSYKYWAFVAVKAWIREIAGGEGPCLGRVKPKEANQLKRKAILKSLGGPKEHQEFEAYDDDHPLVRLFNNPNGPDVAYDLWAYDTMFFLLCGSSHWWVIKNALGTPVEIWVIPTHWMQMVTNDGAPLGYIIQSPFGITQFAPFEDVVSFYEHSPLNRWEGYAVSQAIDMWLDLYDSMTRTRLAMMKNGATPAFHVELGESYADPDEQFLARYYSQWFARFQGEARAGQPLITGADVKINPIGVAPKEVGFETSEDQIGPMVLGAYGVPKAVVGLTTDMTYGSVKASKDAFREYSVNSHLIYRGQVITEKIMHPVDDKGMCYWNDRVTGDPDYRLREHAQDLTTGVRTVNEVRTLRGLEPYEHGGDDPQINNVVTPWATGKRPPQEELLDQALASAAATGKVTDDMLSSAMQHGAATEDGESTTPSESGEDRGTPVSPAQSPAVAGDLRSTVGGSAQIMEMQASLARGEITREMAIANAQIVFGFSQEDAERLFPDSSQANAIKSRISAGKALNGKSPLDTSEAIKRRILGDRYKSITKGAKPWQLTKSEFEREVQDLRTQLDRLNKQSNDLRASALREWQSAVESMTDAELDKRRPELERRKREWDTKIEAVEDQMTPLHQRQQELGLRSGSLIDPRPVHRREVQDAIKQGNSIPSNVLADYPDLKQRKDLGESTGSSGGYLVPPEYATNGNGKRRRRRE